MIFPCESASVRLIAILSLNTTVEDYVEALKAKKDDELLTKGGGNLENLSSVSDYVVNKLETQLADLKSTMNNRLDTELKPLTESIESL